MKPLLKITIPWQSENSNNYRKKEAPLSGTSSANGGLSIRLLPFTVLARRKRFEEIRTLLLDPNVKHQTWLTIGTQKRGATALHVLVEHDPPHDLVALLIDTLSSKPNFVVPEQARNDQNQTPLHVAVGNDCSLAVASQLLGGVSGSFPATIQDNNGFLPLHIACFHKRKDGNTEESAKIMKLLLAHCPHSATVPDNYGYSPLDYAKKMVQTKQWKWEDLQRSSNIPVRFGGKNNIPILRVAKHPPGRPEHGIKRESRLYEEEKKEGCETTDYSSGTSNIPEDLGWPDSPTDDSSVVSELTIALPCTF